MKKTDVIEFFDRLAPQWDNSLIHNDEIINTILDNAKVSKGKDILDVACGTGVLFGDYIKREARSVTAVDISPEMAKIAQNKFPDENIRVLCDDIENIKLTERFDCVMVYNAFPHFPDPKGLINTLADYLRPGGTLCIAHSMSREDIDRHHSGSARDVSVGLMSADELSQIISARLKLTVKISDSRMYQVAGQLI